MNLNTGIANIRKDYKLKELLEEDADNDPINQFQKWWNEAADSKVDEINAMTLATSTKTGKPSARIVLLKGFNNNGFIFFTNYESKKGKELMENPSAALIFFWKELERQVRIEGTVKKVSAKESDEYFVLRPEQSRIGAWSSPQSAVIKDRDSLEKNFEKYTKQYSDAAILRPGHWGGYIVDPDLIEFWQGRPNRLHDRLQYTKKNNDWIIQRLAP